LFEADMWFCWRIFILFLKITGCTFNPCFPLLVDLWWWPVESGDRGKGGGVWSIGWILNLGDGGV